MPYPRKAPLRSRSESSDDKAGEFPFLMENITEHELDCTEEETEVFTIMTHLIRQMQITCVMAVLVVHVALERYYSRHQSRFTEPNPFQ